MSRELKWHETAPGLLYEAIGNAGRRYVISAAGCNWTLDLLIDREYAAEQAVDPQPATSRGESRSLVPRNHE